MPNDINSQTMYFGMFGGPDTFNAAELYEAGQLGLPHQSTDKSYQRVQLDSGATASTPIGAVAANQLAYWKDKNTYLVTNDRRFATTAYQNFVAGVFRLAVTAGYYCDILQRGDNINLIDGGNSFAVGEPVFAEADAAAAVDRVGVGTASTYQQLGTARGAASGGVVAVDVDISPIP